MKISAKSYYGLKALVYLAKKNDFTSVKEVASQEDIPYDFLEKMLASLKKAGFIKVRRGIKGGYMLSSKNKTITVRQIVDHFEGPLTLINCIASDIKCLCPKSKNCLTKSAWLKVQNNLIKTLDSISLKDLV